MPRSVGCVEIDGQSPALVVLGVVCGTKLIYGQNHTINILHSIRRTNIIWPQGSTLHVVYSAAEYGVRVASHCVCVFEVQTIITTGLRQEEIAVMGGPDEITEFYRSPSLLMRWLWRTHPLPLLPSLSSLVVVVFEVLQAREKWSPVPFNPGKSGAQFHSILGKAEPNSVKSSKMLGKVEPSTSKMLKKITIYPWIEWNWAPYAENIL